MEVGVARTPSLFAGLSLSDEFPAAGKEDETDEFETFQICRTLILASNDYVVDSNSYLSKEITCCIQSRLPILVKTDQINLSIILSWNQSLK
ncbi:hypothetical protein R1flu_014614 [Riccia fluitans]|uniref:Uncharacterized protein n=1 Tax=Riccia fluitans TaxID=41844 RepID=A0ABD1YGL4_9MARC